MQARKRNWLIKVWKLIWKEVLTKIQIEESPIKAPAIIGAQYEMDG